MKTLLTVLLIIVIVVTTLTLFGGMQAGYTPAGGWAMQVESDWAATRATEEKEKTKRAEIAAGLSRSLAETQAATTQLVVIIIAGAAVILGGLYLWTRRPVRPQPAPALPTSPPAALLIYLGGHYLPGQADIEWVDGEWAFVDHSRREIVPARLLLGVSE